MKYEVQVMIVSEDGGTETWEEEGEALNHHEALEKAIAQLTANENSRVDATETLVIIAKPKPENADDIPIYPALDLPQRARDSRDPYGHIRTEMLMRKIGNPKTIDAHNIAWDWSQAHPEFQLEYLAELQRRETEALKKSLGTA